MKNLKDTIYSQTWYKLLKFMYFNRNKSVSLIYHGSNVSITTAYVWLNELKKSGLIEKQPIKRTKSKRFNITDKGKKLIETIEGIWNEY